MVSTLDILSDTPWSETMKNRLTPYEAGWLTMLVQQRICTEQQAREAQGRVAHAALEEIERRAKRARAAKRRRRREE